MNCKITKKNKKLKNPKKIIIPYFKLSSNFDLTIAAAAENTL